MRLLFAGTPATALPALQALIASRHEVVAVLTRADAPTGRGRRLTPSPVRVAAQEAGIPVITDLPRGQDFIDQLTALELDACPVVAYGHILGPEVLAIPRLGWVNLHFSILPAWRGAAPVQRAIIAGDQVTGATTFVIDQGMDTGPVLGTMTETIMPKDTSGELLDRLATAGAALLTASMDAMEDGSIQPVPQPAEGVSHAAKLHREDAQVRWDRPAMAIDRLIRGCTPAPGAWSVIAPQGVEASHALADIPSIRLGLGPVRLRQDVTDVPPGAVRSEKKAVLVGTASHAVELGLVQPPGKKPMLATDWVRGARLSAQAAFVQPPADAGSVAENAGLASASGQASATEQASASQGQVTA